MYLCVVLNTIYVIQIQGPKHFAYLTTVIKVRVVIFFTFNKINNLHSLN